LNIPTLAAWYKNVKTTVYWEIRQQLVRRHIVPKVRNCGSCKYLPQSKICQKTGERRNKGDKACEKYRPEVPNFEPIDAPARGRDGNENQSNDRLLYAMLSAAHDEALSPEAALISEEQAERSALDNIVEMLIQRFQQETPGSRTRTKYKRQYEEFSNLLDLLSENMTIQKVFQTLADRFQCTTKTVRNDVQGIKNFLNDHDILITELDISSIKESYT